MHVEGILGIVLVFGAAMCVAFAPSWHHLEVTLAAAVQGSL